MNGKSLQLFILLTLLFCFRPLADESGIGQSIRIWVSSFFPKMEYSLNELRKRPYPFDDWISRHGKSCFPKWDRESQLRWLTELFPLTDAGATFALMEVARENDLLLAWDLYAMRLPPEKRKRLRQALGYLITQKYWQHTLEITLDGTYILHLKDLRDGAECVFRARCGRIPEQGELKVSPFNSDLEIGYRTERTIRKDNQIIYESGCKVLFAVRRDAETNLWFETGSWAEVRKKTPAVTVYEEIRNVPVCSGIIDGKKVFRTFRLRAEARKFKLGSLRSGDILQLPADEILPYSSEFEVLAEKAGCTGAEVFDRSEWRKFFASAKKDSKRFEFLLTRFSVPRSTRIHICNWENASQGVLAVMSVEIITGRSWLDYDGANPDIRKYVKLAKTNFPRHFYLKKILADPVCRRELQNFFRRAYSDKNQP